MSELTVTQPQQLLQIAVEKGAELDKLERLMDLQERWQANEAQKAFNEALAGFQRDCPKIEKTKTGYNDVKYADLDDISTAIL